MNQKPIQQKSPMNQKHLLLIQSKNEDMSQSKEEVKNNFPCGKKEDTDINKFLTQKILETSKIKTFNQKLSKKCETNSTKILHTQHKT